MLTSDFDIKAIYGALFLRERNALIITSGNYSDHHPFLYVPSFESKNPIFPVFLCKVTILYVILFQFCTYVYMPREETSVFLE